MFMKNELPLIVLFGGIVLFNLIVVVMIRISDRRAAQAKPKAQ